MARSLRKEMKRPDQHDRVASYMGPLGFEPRTDRLCIPLQLSLPLWGLWAGLSLHPSRVPAVQSLHLPLQSATTTSSRWRPRGHGLGAFSGQRGLARDYRILRFRLPRIWQVSPVDYSTGSPCEPAALTAELWALKHEYTLPADQRQAIAFSTLPQVRNLREG